MSFPSDHHHVIQQQQYDDDNNDAVVVDHDVDDGQIRQHVYHHYNNSHPPPANNSSNHSNNDVIVDYPIQQQPPPYHVPDNNIPYRNGWEQQQAALHQHHHIDPQQQQYNMNHPNDHYHNANVAHDVYYNNDNNYVRQQPQPRTYEEEEVLLRQQQQQLYPNGMYQIQPPIHIQQQQSSSIAQHDDYEMPQHHHQQYPQVEEELQYPTLPTIPILDDVPVASSIEGRVTPIMADNYIQQQSPLLDDANNQVGEEIQFNNNDKSFNLQSPQPQSSNTNNYSSRHLSPLVNKPQLSRFPYERGTSGGLQSTRSNISASGNTDDYTIYFTGAVGDTCSVTSNTSFRHLVQANTGTNQQQQITKGTIHELRDPSYLINILEDMVPKIVNNQFNNNTNKNKKNLSATSTSMNNDPQQQQQQQENETNNNETKQQRTSVRKDHQRRDQAEYVWDCIRRWLWANPKYDDDDSDNENGNNVFEQSYMSMGIVEGGSGGGSVNGNNDDINTHNNNNTKKNTNRHTRRIGAYAIGENDITPLHYVCKLSYPPEDIIDALINAAPDCVTYKDSHGWIPLHYVCANGCNVEVMKLLIDSYPSSTIQQDLQKRTPLHFYSTRHPSNGDNPNIMSLNTMMLCKPVNYHHIDSMTAATPDTPATDTLTPTNDNTPLSSSSTHSHSPSISGNINSTDRNDRIKKKLWNAAEITDVNGMLPIHYACAYGTHALVLQVLANAYPIGLIARERHGRVPMHLAMVNAHRDQSDKVIKFLLEYNTSSKNTINSRDNQGYLPLHLLVESLKQQMVVSMKSYRVSNDIDKQHTVSECLSLYLNAEPIPVPDLLPAIKDLPDWLLDTAVVSKHVRNVLNQKIVKRLPTSILLLDGFVLFMVIICFTITGKNHIDLRFDPTNSTNHTISELVLVFIGASYFCVREVIQFIALWSLGHAYRWFKDYANWLDVCVIVLVFYYSIKMLYTDQSTVITPSAFRTGIAITQGLLWAAIIVYLKKINVGFAVFVGGVFYVLQRLVAFMIAVGTILIAFGQMFYFVYVDTPMCEDNYNTSHELGSCTFPHCNFPSSLLKVYTMMMGEVTGFVRYSTNLHAQILFVAYAFLVIILLSNVLIAIVQDSYEVVQNERAAIVFWYNRLEFIAEVDSISYAIQRLCGKSNNKIMNNNNNNDDNNHNKMNLLNSDSSNNKNNNGDDGDGNGDNDQGQDDNRRTTAFQRMASSVAFSRPSKPTSSTKLKVDTSNFDVSADFMPEPFDTDMNLNEQKDDKDIFRIAWKQLISLFDRSLYDNSLMDSILHNLFCVLTSLFIIPLWCIIGFVTVGLLWPPQIREMLFAQKEIVITRAELNRQKLDQLKAIETDMKDSKVDIRDEMDNGRTLVQKLKADIEIVQGEIYVDLIQIKEILESILVMTIQNEGQQE